jgi:uncharacterized protein
MRAPGLPLVDAVLARGWRRDSRLHGEAHWRAVTVTGLDLADGEPGADHELVFLFGLLHDTRRESDGPDPGHGLRAAGLAAELHAEGAFTLEADRLERLLFALERHAHGEVSDDPRVGACWDADRLHLPRCGFTVDKRLLSTAAARLPTAEPAAAARRAETPEWPALVERVEAARAAA